MEFMSRSGNTAAPQAPPAVHPGSSATTKRKAGDGGMMRYLFMILIGGVTLLLVALVAFSLTSNKGVTAEASLVDGNKYQAVFLNNGQVYFGKIKTLNRSYVVIDDIFYIEAQSTQQANNNNYTLRKLGTSELHAPEDRMVVNRDQVTFWENLKDSGRVVTAIKQYKQNPNASNQVQQPSGGSNTQPNPNTNQSGANTNKPTNSNNNN